MNTWLRGLLVVSLLGCGILIGITMSWWNMEAYKQKEVVAVVQLFPQTVTEIETRTELLIERITKKITTLIAIPVKEKTFENTVRAFDEIVGGDFVQERDALGALSYVSTDAAVREASQKASIELGQFALKMFLHNIELYDTFKAYVEGNRKQEQLTQEQAYFVDEQMRSFKRSGLDLPKEQRDKIADIQNKLTQLTSDFDFAINGDKTKVNLTRDELVGVDEDLIATLPKNDDGTYAVGVDYPTYHAVVEHCTNGRTREKMFVAFRNRAYPQNIPVLEEIIAQRDELAHLLGFTSFAAYSLDDEMVRTVERAETFLDDLIAKAKIKETKEFQKLTQELPQGVVLSPQGKMYPWDKAFTRERYKEKHFKLDDRKVSEYFPTEKTLQGLLAIYEKFFSLEFKDVPVVGLWDPEVRMLHVVHKPSGAMLGYLLLDIYPRANKYSHACHMTIVPAHNKEGAIPVSVVIANFPKATASKPALLKLADVRTFFHEFGHALHALFGRTEMKLFAGTNTKTDFVEMPSQMLEEWLWDKSIVKNLSSHYQTGEHMPDDMLHAIIELKNFSTGDTVLQQAFYALLSLEYYKEGKKKDTTQILHNLCARVLSNTECSQDDHMQAAFGHLTSYGARYYGYMWSKVFALDLFEQIKQVGLLNPTIGTKYVDTVLSKGGSKDPNELLKDFLGREPNQEAFFKDLGLDQ